MNPLSRLRELAALSTASVKEFGILTKNEAAYDKDGTFTGIENHYNGPGIAEAAGGAALVGAGLGAGHVGVMKKYGAETLRREKGRFITPKEVKVPVGQAYKKAGSDVLAKIRSLAGKRFSSKDRLKELAGKVPRLTLAIQRQGILTRGEAESVPRSHRYGIDYGPEAVNHYGGNKKLITDAIKNRHRILPEIRRRSAMLSAHDRLKDLAEKSVALKSFDQKVDENGHPILDTAVGAGLGAGAVLGHQAIMRKYGQNGGGIGAAYGAAANDFKGGFQRAFNPPSTSDGSGSVATASTNSPLSHDGAKFAGVAPSVDAAHGVGGTAKVVEDSGEALNALKKASPLAKTGAAVGTVGSKIRGLLSGLRKVV